MKRTRTGSYVASSTGGEQVQAFVPDPLPPQPPLEISSPLRARLDEALLALGRLDSITTLLPDKRLLLYGYVRKEAVLSSQIEGTQSTLSDLLLFEEQAAPGVPVDDVTEVSNYVRAIEHGLDRVRGGLPISNRLIREIHEILLASGRGAKREPGSFRTSQNWLGGSRPGNAQYVPPPWDKVEPCMAALERFIHDDPHPTAPLIKAALAHVQFETIHPFLDGNGRVGRLLITLLLCSDHVLREPTLYLSLYLKLNRDTYYDHLQRVRIDGDWEGWLEFFATGVHEVAQQAVTTATRIHDLFQVDRDRIRARRAGGGSALPVHEALQLRPITTIAHAAVAAGRSIPTVTAALEALGELGIVREITGHKRNRIFAYTAYLSILNEGGEPL